MKRLKMFLMAASVFGVTIADGTTAQGAKGNTVQSMQWQRRIVLFCASNAADPAFDEQRKLLSSWHGATDRDVSMVQIAGGQVNGATDSAADLRQRYDLPADHFAVILIGKDGHVALKSTTHLSTDVLTETIDAMPMRREGQR